MGYGPFGKKKPSPQSPQTPFELMPNNPLLQPVRQDNGTIFNPQNGKVIDPLTGMTLVDPGAANYKSAPHNPLAWAQNHFGGLHPGAGNGGQTGGMPPMGNSNTSGMGVMGSPAPAAAGPAVAMPAQPAPQPLGQPRDWTPNDFMNLLMIERAKNQQEADAALKSAAFWGPIKKLALGTIAATSPYNANVAYHGMKNVSNGITAANQAYANAFDPSMPLAAAKILAENNPGKYEWHKEKAENDRERNRINRERAENQNTDWTEKRKLSNLEYQRRTRRDIQNAGNFKAMLDRKDKELQIALQNAQTSQERNDILARMGVIKDAGQRLDAEAAKQSRRLDLATKAATLDEYGQPKYPGLVNLIKDEEPDLYDSLFGNNNNNNNTTEDTSASPIDSIMNSAMNFLFGGQQVTNNPVEQQSPVETFMDPDPPQTNPVNTGGYKIKPQPAQAPKPAPPRTVVPKKTGGSYVPPPPKTAPSLAKPPEPVAPTPDQMRQLGGAQSQSNNASSADEEDRIIKALEARGYRVSRRK